MINGEEQAVTTTGSGYQVCNHSGHTCTDLYSLHTYVYTQTYNSALWNRPFPPANPLIHRFTR